MATAPNAPSSGNAALRISLNVILGAALADALFLVALVVALAIGGRGAAGVPAAPYAFGVLYLLSLAAPPASRPRSTRSGSSTCSTWRRRARWTGGGAGRTSRSSR